MCVCLYRLISSEDLLYNVSCVVEMVITWSLSIIILPLTTNLKCILTQKYKNNNI